MKGVTKHFIYLDNQDVKQKSYDTEHIDRFYTYHSKEWGMMSYKVFVFT